MSWISSNYFGEQYHGQIQILSVGKEHMRAIKFLLGLALRILLIPVWIILALAWLTAMAVVRIGCVAKGLVSSVLLFILVGTLIWFRTEWMRYILLAIAEGILFAILFAGAIVEVTLASFRARVGSFIFYNA